MLSPIILMIVNLLNAGGISVSCINANAGIYAKETNPSESWTIECLSEVSTDGLYRYQPVTNYTLIPVCGTSGNYNVSARRTRISNGNTATLSSVVGVAWLCPEKKQNFDSTFNVAISDVGKSPSFWTLFLCGIGAGIFIGSAPMGVQAIRKLMDGDRDD